MHMQGAHEVDGDQVFPIRRVRLQEGPEDVPSGIVHEHRNRPEFRLRRRHRGLDAGTVGDIASIEPCRPIAGADFANRPFSGRLVAIEDRDLAARGSKTPRGGGADPASCTGDDDRPVLELWHGRSSGRSISHHFREWIGVGLSSRSSR